MLWQIESGKPSMKLFFVHIHATLNHSLAPCSRITWLLYGTFIQRLSVPHDLEIGFSDYLVGGDRLKEVGYRFRNP